MEELASVIIKAKRKLHPCRICGNLTESDTCNICADSRRDHALICVVEEPSDVAVIENSGEYMGVYHVIGGVLSPLDGRGPDDINLASLEKRVAKGAHEVILATNTNLEGEQTALYLSKLIAPLGIKVTRLARGLPFGTELEYADDVTLTRALEGRQEF